LGKAFLISQRQSNHLGLLNGPLRGVLDGGNHEIRHGAALHLGGPFKQGV
jgi:hypothetical protein